MNLTNFSFTQLKYIIAVDKYKNFGKAAKECAVSQPSLSIQVQKLETTLGTIIFDRSKNPIMTTALGTKIIKQAKIILKEQSRMEELINSEQQDLQGQLKIAIIPTIAAYLIPHFLFYFKQHYPHVDLILEEQTTEQILHNLDSDNLDGGILATPLYQDNLIERHLYYEDFFIYVHPNHPLAKHQYVSAQDIAHFSPWVLAEGHCFRNQTLNLCDYKHSSAGSIRFESGSFETLIRLIDTEPGFTVIPQMLLPHLSNNQKQKVIPFKKPIPTREISLIHDRIFLKEKLLDALEQAIINTLPSEIKTNKGKDATIIDI